MSPSLVSEIRDLQPLVSSVLARFAAVFAVLALCLSVALLAASIMVLAKEERLYGLTLSGQPFELKPMDEIRAQQLLSQAAAQQAVEQVRNAR